MSRYKSRRIDGVSKKEHIIVWENARGEIPEGYDIHHIDGNGNNNDLSNLQMLSHQEHMALHAKMRAEGTDPVQDDMPGVLKHRQQVKESRLRHLEKRMEYDRKRHEEHADEINARRREQYAENPEPRKASCARYEETHKEERAQRNTEYYAAHTEERLEYAKAYRKKNAERIAARCKAYREAHKEERYAKAAAVRAEQREYLAAKQRVYMARKKGLAPEIIAQRVAEMEAERAKLEAKKQQGGQIG